MKKYSKDQLLELAKEVFEHHPEEKQVLATEDGNIFLVKEKGSAINHATRAGLEKPVTIEREECNTSKADKKAATEAAKAKEEADNKAAAEAAKAKEEADKKAATEAAKAKEEADNKAATEAAKAKEDADNKAATEAAKAKEDADKKAATEAAKVKEDAGEGVNGNEGKEPVKTVAPAPKAAAPKKTAPKKVAEKK